MARIGLTWVRSALDFAGIVSLVRALDLDLRAVVAGVVVGAAVSVPGDAVSGVAAGLGAAVLVRRTGRGPQSWQRTAGAALLGLLLRLSLGELADVKLEEWCGDLAGIASRWERTVYMIDLIGHLPQQAGAAREGGRNGFMDLQ